MGVQRRHELIACRDQGLFARPQSCGCRFDDDSTTVWFSSMG